MTPAIDRAMDHQRSKLTRWELDFLAGVADAIRKGRVSVKQKTCAIPVLKRVGAWSQ